LRFSFLSIFFKLYIVFAKLLTASPACLVQAEAWDEIDRKNPIFIYFHKEDPLAHP